MSLASATRGGIPQIPRIPRSETITPSGFGRVVEGLSLGEVTEEQLAALRELWLDSGGLLVLRGEETLCPKDFLRFCRSFGPLEKNEKYDPDFLLPGYPEILRLGNLHRDGKYRALFVRAEPGQTLWHTDDSFRWPQPAGSIFHCRNHPETGGGTWYAGMAHAYEALPLRLRERIEGRSAVHSYTFLDNRLRRDNPHRRKMPMEVRRAHPPVVRPLVARHPETGRKALLIPDCHIESVSGLDDSETRSLLAELQAHATGERFTVCWQWRPGDIAVWDNRSAMHAGSPFDEREPRLMYRVTFAGPELMSSPSRPQPVTPGVGVQKEPRHA